MKKGFTLIELLVVIAIIGILSSVVLASLNSARSKGRDASRVTDIKQLQLAYELYYDSCSRYPGDGLDNTSAEGCTGGTTLADFMNSIPTDPGSNSYEYGVATGGTDYVLKATLENENHTAVQSDVDGTVLTINCGSGASTEVEFCVQP